MVLSFQKALSYVKKLMLRKLHMYVIQCLNINLNCTISIPNMSHFHPVAFDRMEFYKTLYKTLKKRFTKRCFRPFCN